jgi:tRNA (Thr-GGU) A37 N-methylase
MMSQWDVQRNPGAEDDLVESSSRLQTTLYAASSATELLGLIASRPAEALDGIEAFSHAEVISASTASPRKQPSGAARQPSGTTPWPKMGIFAQRPKGRPNRVGVTSVEIINRLGRVLTVASLGTPSTAPPVLDIKMVMGEFLPGS